MAVIIIVGAGYAFVTAATTITATSQEVHQLQESTIAKPAIEIVNNRLFDEFIELEPPPKPALRMQPYIELRKPEAKGYKRKPVVKIRSFNRRTTGCKLQPK